MKEKLVIGMDFGTDSARGLLVDPFTGSIRASAVSYFKRWKQGLYCNPDMDQYRQHPLDYTEAINEILEELLKGRDAGAITAIATSTTGSTPVAVDEKCRPLALSDEFSENPNAMFVLWKDHTALREAEEINSLARKWETDYTLYSGGIYSSEWFWSKILHINWQDEKVHAGAFTWLEQSDWIPAYLSGVENYRDIRINRCAAGHKAMWNDASGGLPSADFLNALDPGFKKLEGRFYTETYTSDQVFGTVSPDLARRFGFDPSTVITVGAIDAHHGAVGSGISPYTLVKVIGTSTCDMLVAPGEMPLVEGICGQVDGSIIPGMTGFEAGQSAFGDIYNAFRKMMLTPTYDILGDQLNGELSARLENDFFDYVTAEASQIPVRESDLVFTDYHNGRRTPDADFSLKASAHGFGLSTRAGHFFKALVEATAFGSRAIMERFLEYSIPIENVIASGGIPNKSPYVVQVLADVLGVDIQVTDSDQTCALGSAVFAAVATGVYPDIESAQKVIAAKRVKTCKPDPERGKVYETLYKTYLELTRLRK